MRNDEKITKCSCTAQKSVSLHWRGSLLYHIPWIYFTDSFFQLVRFSIHKSCEEKRGKVYKNLLSLFSLSITMKMERRRTKIEVS